MTQVLWDGHWLERAHPGPSGVADGNPQSRKQHRGQHPRKLTGYFAVVAPMPGREQHQPVHVRVTERRTLCEDVGAFEMSETRGEVAATQGQAGLR